MNKLNIIALALCLNTISISCKDGINLIDSTSQTAIFRLCAITSGALIIQGIYNLIQANRIDKKLATAGTDTNINIEIERNRMNDCFEQGIEGLLVGTTIGLCGVFSAVLCNLNHE